MSSGQNIASAPISSLDVAWEEWSEVPRIGVRYRHLTRAAAGENYHVGVAIEELGPGKQSSPAHYHMLEEEHVYLMEGELIVRLGVDMHEMHAGDYLCFPAGQQAGHCLINRGEAPCRYVIVGERNPNDVVVYTDSRKVMVAPLGGRGAIFDLAARRGYWHGERTGLAEGETPPSAAPSAAAATVQPRAPISSNDVAWQDTHEGTRFGGRAKHLTSAAVGPSYRVGMLLEAPAPGMRLAPRHCSRATSTSALAKRTSMSHAASRSARPCGSTTARTPTSS